MRIDVGAFRLAEGEPASLAKRATRVEPFYQSKADYAKILAKHVAALSTLQERLFRSARYALLIVLQGMDTAGKDGAIAHVMSGVNPQGCKVVAFKQPTPIDAARRRELQAIREMLEK
jgi:polyphosphate kinase 2 (PPK2 family)